MTEQQLIVACLRKKPKAQRYLYDKYKVMLFRVCLRYANGREEAEDMLQEGFIKIFQDLKQFSGKGKLGAWMRRVVVNVALQHIRKRKNLFPAIDIDLLAHRFKTDDNIIAQLNAKDLTKMVQQLPPGYRAVFNMYVVEGYSHKEIAAELGINWNTSKSQLSKARAALRRMLEKQMMN